jgi:hypothetical protein
LYTSICCNVLANRKLPTEEEYRGASYANVAKGIEQTGDEAGEETEWKEGEAVAALYENRRLRHCCQRLRTRVRRPSAKKIEYCA